MAQTEFKILVDENMLKVIAAQLLAKGIIAIRLHDVLPEGTKDPEILEYCFQNTYSLLTHDNRITGHITERHSQGKEHYGVFIAEGLQGQKGVGRIILFMAEWNELILGGAASVENDVYNQVIYVK
jgi:hypothetical protein